MSKLIDDLAAKFLEARGESGESEQRVIERLTKRLHASRDAGRAFEESLTFGQRLADRTTVSCSAASTTGWRRPVTAVRCNAAHTRRGDMLSLHPSTQRIS
jgi:hypothetical protein